MFCQSCGYEFAEEKHYCTQCGALLNYTKNVTHNLAERLIGFSPKINDPAFKSYLKKSSLWSFIFTFILAFIATIGFPIYGNTSGDIDWPDSLYYGLGIGFMFILIAALQTIKRKFDKTWDGIVTYKDSYREKKRNRNGHIYYRTVYIIKVKKASGKIRKHKWRDIPGPYSYYNVGDKVRHHKGFYYYEKYDKSKDTKIMCAACMSFIDITSDVCNRCKCPLLK